MSNQPTPFLAILLGKTSSAKNYFPGAYETGFRRNWIGDVRSRNSTLKNKTNRCEKARCSSYIHTYIQIHPIIVKDTVGIFDTLFFRKKKIPVLHIHLNQNIWLKYKKWNGVNYNYIWNVCMFERVVAFWALISPRNKRKFNVHRTEVENLNHCRSKARKSYIYVAGPVLLLSAR